MNDIDIIKGNFVYSTSPLKMEIHSESYIVLHDGAVEGLYKELPEKYNGIQIRDFGSNMIIPGFVDLHIHASQFYQRGLGMNMELIDWLNTYTFPQETQFSDLEYAKKVYGHFADELVKQGTLFASIFATIHGQGTEILFDLLDKKGIYAFVGKINMDRNSSAELIENTQESIKLTEELICKYRVNQRVKPILTPRFVPACSCELLQALGALANKYNIPVQSHISENRNEVNWVKELHPEFSNYASIYESYGLFGQTSTLMAHCVYLTDEEIEMAAKKGVYSVHCPDSNANLTSGIMPVRKLLKRGLKIGLGSDVGGGHEISMAKVIVSAIQQSKLMSVINPENEPLSIEEAFYMATKGGGGFFGKVGSFEKGYGFHANVIDDSGLGDDSLSLKDRLQRFLYIGDDRNIAARFVDGHELM